MNRPSKTSWKAIRVRRPGAVDLLRDVDAAERLAALYRFQNGDAGSDHAFLRSSPEHAEAHVTDPAEVDWETFPVLAALEAVTRDELRRLRRLLRADAANLWDEPTPPHGSGLGGEVEPRA